MKTRECKTAARMAAMALTACAAFALAACGGDDEPSVEEVLSDKTTSVEYKLPGGSSHKYILFDYAGGGYVGSDTVSGKSCSVTLRQGPHHLVWTKGLSYYNKKLDAGMSVSGASFNPKDKTFTTPLQYGLFGDVTFTECDFEVTPATVQGGTVVCDEYATCALRIEVSDGNGHVAPPSPFYEKVIGKASGLPFVTAVPLSGGRYDTQGQTLMVVYSHASDDGRTDAMMGFQYDGRIRNVNDRRFLCPPEGIDGIRLEAEVRDEAGNIVPTTKMPKFSLRRGTTTTLRGPLFSGKESDWIVTMDPYWP